LIHFCITDRGREINPAGGGAFIFYAQFIAARSFGCGG
jgi:hypothetical protein